MFAASQGGQVQKKPPSYSLPPYRFLLAGNKASLLPHLRPFPHEPKLALCLIFSPSEQRSSGPAINTVQDHRQSAASISAGYAKKMTITPRPISRDDTPGPAAAAMNGNTDTAGAKEGSLSHLTNSEESYKDEDDRDREEHEAN